MATSTASYFYDGYGEHGYRAVINLWWEGSGATSAVLHASGGGQLYNSTGWNGSSINIAGTTASGNCTSSASMSWVNSNWWWSNLNLGTVTKTHYAQTISRTCKFNYGGKGEVSVTASISLPAKTSYSVTYNAGEGSGAPANQTKWYGETLTLQTGIPTRAGFAFKGWQGSNGVTYQAGSNYTGNAALSLTAIWQALVTDLEEVEDCEIGEAPVLAWTPQADDLTYYLSFSLNEWSYKTEIISPGSTSRYVFDDYTIPMAVCSQLPDNTAGLMKVELETYNGEDKTGVSEQYFTVAVPDTVVPVISSLSIADASNNALNVYLQNYSWLTVNLSLTTAYGSEITSVVLEAGEEEQTVVPESSSVTMTTEILPEYGETDVTVTITDQRGRTATQTSTITVHEYAPPTVELDVSLEGTNTVVTTIAPAYSTVGGSNSATFTVNEGTARPVVNGQTTVDSFEYIYATSRNYTCTVVVTDRVTSTTVTRMLYPGRGSRFETLDPGKFYTGIDQYGWQDVESQYNGGINEDGVIWFERTSGSGPLGIGFPVQVEPDTDYELIYSADKVNADTVVLMSFFSDNGTGELGYSYLGTTYDGNHLKSGAIFHTPELEAGTMWGLLLLGVDPASYEETLIGYQEFTAITFRKVERKDEALEWEIETGNLGLDTPNQKYISRLQMRIEYYGTLRIWIAYDNSSKYEQVHTSASKHMRSQTVGINVRRCDHFRLKLEGVGQAHLYSFGYNTEDGSTRCLI